MIKIISILMITSIILFTGCSNNSKVGETKPTSSSQSSNEFTKGVESNLRINDYLVLSREEIIKKIGNENVTGTVSMEKSHMIFPCLISKKLGISFIFPFEGNHVKPLSVSIFGGDNISNVNVRGAKPGMTFKEIQELLGTSKVEKTWMASEENLEYKIEYKIDGLVYKFFSYNREGTSSELKSSELIIELENLHPMPTQGAISSINNPQPTGLISEKQQTTKDYNASTKWLFSNKDIFIDGKSILDTTFEKINKDLGKEYQIRNLRARANGSILDDYENILVVEYHSIEIELEPSTEEKKQPLYSDKVFRFDITKEDIKLDCGLKVGMTIDEIKSKFGDRNIYNINESKETYELNDIKSVLSKYKPENYYSNYSKAMIIYADAQKFGESSLAMSLVLLINRDKVDRIVFGYPTAG